jgi:putative acetyltransferase
MAQAAYSLFLTFTHKGHIEVNGKPAPMSKEKPAIEIRRESPDSPAAKRLIKKLDEDLLERYPLQFIHGLRPGDSADPDLFFVVAYADNHAVGIGALRPLEPGVGEIKRMFVLPEHRGKGVGRAVLSALEAQAVKLGYSSVRLETGTKQPEAIALYRSAGYAGILNFGEYADNPMSVCFEKKLG